MTKDLTKPAWLRVRLGGGPGYSRLQKLLHDRGLHTVCEEALCPNKGRCWEHGRATVMILGNTCTRNCTFCNVVPGRPAACDQEEPRRVADAVKAMKISEIVITSVTRDDLEDGGAAIWAETIRQVRDGVPGIVLEVLIPDFKGKMDLIGCVLAAKPDVLGHNVETVPRLYRKVRPQADYRRSLDVLKHAHERGFITKTGIMVGLGESESEVVEVMDDAVGAGCDIFTIGQYLRPSRRHVAVDRYVEPAEFDRFRDVGLSLGFKVVISAPLVRSSYHSEEQSAFLARNGLRRPFKPLCSVS
jgi:lipoyl synthase